MKKKANFDIFKSGYAGDGKPVEEILPVPGVMDNKVDDDIPLQGIIEQPLPCTETKLRHQAYKKPLFTVEEIRGKLETLFQDHFTVEDYAQITAVKENGIFFYSTGQSKNVHLFKAKWKLNGTEIVVDFNAVVAIYQEAPPMLTPEQQEESLKHQDDEVEELPLPHPDQVIRQRDVELTDDEKINILIPKTEKEEQK